MSGDLNTGTARASTRMSRMDEDLQIALAPVLADLTSATPFTPEFRDDEWSGLQGVAATMIFFGGSGTGISINVGSTRAQQVTSLADQIQEAAVEALWGSGHSPVWPECPEHPDTHPLRPVESNDTAVWVCPKSRTEICLIGSLSTVRATGAPNSGKLRTGST